MKWLALLLWDPKNALDWCDRDGNYDYAKVLPSLLVIGLTVATILVSLTPPVEFPPVGLTIVLISASFGQSMWRSFLKSKTVTSQEQIKTAIERRDQALGAEATP